MSDGVRDDEPVTDRRGMVKLLAAGAAGAAAGAVMQGAPAAAIDGDPLLMGEANATESVTSLMGVNESALNLNSQNGFGLIANGSVANAWFVGGGDPPVGTPAVLGTLYVDASGGWWVSTADSDTDGQWRRLAGPESAGSLNLLAAPRRVYDSRPGEAPTDIGPKAPLDPNSPRTIDATLNDSGVPAAARGVLITLTATGTGGPGFASVWPTGPWPGTSNLNFTSGGATIATTTVVGLSGATFQVLSNTSTDVIVDVIGVYI